MQKLVIKQFMAVSDPGAAGVLFLYLNNVYTRI